MSGPSLLVRIGAYRLLLVLALVVFAADQATKAWIYETLPFGTFFAGERIDVIPGFLHLVHVGNTGAAWGLFEGKSFWLGIFGIITLAIIYFFRRQLGLRLAAVQAGFGLLVGGVAGNIVDRLVHGHVTDWIDFQFGSWHWPTFNLADSGIVLGVAIYLWVSFRHPQLKV